jgi:nitroreductase/NAD-dependent dihydropyrimidine dehydrogenase PreA subunit
MSEIRYFSTEKPMLNFTIDKTICTSCQLCAKNCIARIIEMSDGYPVIPADKEENCYKCQHCLTVCPTGAVSILGLKATDSRPLAGNYPNPDQLETLIKGRRSIRSYKQENLEPEVINRLLEVAWHAPTGKNCRQVLFTVVDDLEKLAKLRSQIMSRLGEIVRGGNLPERMAPFADYVQLWEEKGIDTLFRGAPHLLIASAPKDMATPTQDCLIAMSYFELFAQSMGVGTVWDGLLFWTINALMPEMRTILQIPENHEIGYMMVFGKPAVEYARTAQHTPPLINRLEL